MLVCHNVADVPRHDNSFINLEYGTIRVYLNDKAYDCNYSNCIALGEVRASTSKAKLFLEVRKRGEGSSVRLTPEKIVHAAEARPHQKLQNNRSDSLRKFTNQMNNIEPIKASNKPAGDPKQSTNMLSTWMFANYPGFT